MIFISKSKTNQHNHLDKISKLTKILINLQQSWPRLSVLYFRSVKVQEVLFGHNCWFFWWILDSYCLLHNRYCSIPLLISWLLFVTAAYWWLLLVPTFIIDKQKDDFEVEDIVRQHVTIVLLIWSLNRIDHLLGPPRFVLIICLE